MAIDLNLKILVVDDQDAQREVIKLILEQLGFTNIYGAASGEDGLDLLKVEKRGGLPIEFIISDYMMPEMTGIEFFKQIQKDPDNILIPFLLISGDADKSFITSAIKIGIRYILLKPFTKQGMVNEMAKIFK